MSSFYPEFYIDLETTGLNPNEDRICQIGAILPNGDVIDTLVNPDRPIGPGSTALHGISDDMVKDAPYFEDVAGRIIDALENSKVFIAYNFLFDFQFLQNELFRTVNYKLHEDDFIFIDPYKIFKTMFPHSLSNAYYFYTGKQMEKAHSAINDIMSTKVVLDKQRKLYSDLFSKTPEEIQAITVGDTSIIGKWFKKIDQKVRFKQGKYRGEVVDPEIHTNYLQWIYSLDDLSLSEKIFISSLINKK